MTDETRYTEGELDDLVELRMQAAIEAGHPPVHVDAWLAEARRREIANEQKRPGFIRSALRGLRPAINGRKVTGWRAVRGTHGMDFLYDPTGTDEPPKGYNRDVAEAEYRTRVAQQKRQPPAEAPAEAPAPPAAQLYDALGAPAALELAPPPAPPAEPPTALELALARARSTR